ncbi:MAG: hypothetical protein LBD51_10715 [Bifidobacteriaceae bacterium]|jgi:hypothetical protein|nr:hypothetical protein [Bifidobacteriaceae bacterium]
MPPARPSAIAHPPCLGRPTPTDARCRQSPRTAPAAKTLKRKVAIREELRTIVVFCEGKGSEPDYVTG